MKKHFLFSLLFTGSCMLLAQNPENAQVAANVDRNSNEISNSNDYILKNSSFKGLYTLTDFGFLVGTSKNKQEAPFAFTTIIDYHFSEKFAAGAGVGIEFLEESYMPVMLDVRYYWRKSNFSPFLFLQGGYHVPMESEISNEVYYAYQQMWSVPIEQRKIKPQGGYLVNPGFGIRNMFNQNFGITFTASYRFQRISYEWDDKRELETEYNRLALKIGIIFK